MDRKCPGTPHLGSWDTLAICPIAFRCALPKQQWVTKGINTLSLKCWLLPACCVSVGSAALVLGAFSSLCSRLHRNCLQFCWQNCLFSQMRGFLCFSITINSEEVWLMSHGAWRPLKANMLLQAPEWDHTCYLQPLAWMLTFFMALPLCSLLALGTQSSLSVISVSLDIYAVRLGAECNPEGFQQCQLALIASVWETCHTVSSLISSLDLCCWEASLISSTKWHNPERT